MNTSWIVVAFAVSIFVCGGEIGWRDEFGVAGSVPAALAVVALVAAVGCQRVIGASDWAWAFVAGWALRGIYRMQAIQDSVRFPIAALSEILANAARYGSFALAAAVMASVALAVIARVTQKPRAQPVQEETLDQELTPSASA